MNSDLAVWRSPLCPVQLEGRIRDLALFNLAIDRKLRTAIWSSFASLILHRAGTKLITTVHHKKTGRRVVFELTSTAIRTGDRQGLTTIGQKRR